MAGNSSGARRSTTPWRTNPESNTAGKGMLAIAMALGVGASTVQRVKERSFQFPATM